MPESYVDIESISELHELYSVGKPKHPLISVIDFGNDQIDRPKDAATYRVGFYTIF